MALCKHRLQRKIKKIYHEGTQGTEKTGNIYHNPPGEPLLFHNSPLDTKAQKKHKEKKSSAFIHVEIYVFSTFKFFSVPLW